MLNELCKPAKEALAAGAISLAQAEALTLGHHNAQRDVLEDIERGRGPYSADDIRDHLLDDRTMTMRARKPAASSAIVSGVRDLTKSCSSGVTAAKKAKRPTVLKSCVYHPPRPTLLPMRRL